MTWFRRPPPPAPVPAPAPEPAQIEPGEAAWPFTADSPHVAETLRQGRKVQLMLVDLTGLDWPQIQPLLPTAREVAQAQGMVPVLVVDLVDFSGLRTAGLAYDCLPNAAANAPLAPALDWPPWVARCRQLLTAKWQPAAIVHLGTHAEW